MSNQKPQITKDESREIKAANKVIDEVVLIGIRGYYLDTFGKRGENDRNVYDDVILLLSPRRFKAFRANTDPSVYRAGIATMKTGVHRYYKGKHKKRYWALRLVGEQVPVSRDGQNGTKVGIALNIHKGGNRTTGSEGCQTLMPNDWDEFIELVYEEMEHYDQANIPYILIEEKDRRRGAFKMPTVVKAPVVEKGDEDILGNQVQHSQTELPSVIQSNTNQNNSANSAINNPNQVQSATNQNAGTNFDFGGYINKAQETFSEAQGTAENAAQTYDQLQSVINTISNRKDSVKSLWTLVCQLVLQPLWALLAFFLAIPTEMWIVVAIIAGIVALLYLHRQNSLGKVREMARLKVLDLAELLK